MKKRLVVILSMLIIGGGAYGVFATVISQHNSAKIAINSAAKTAPAKTNTNVVVDTTPLEIVANVQKYLNKNIRMKATFDKFSTLGLDYTPALRKSEDYIGILIRRDDVTDHVMPLSEMKLFLNRKVAEKYIELESGDKIQIEGKVFSAAMTDPWIDITKLTVLSSKKSIKAK